MPTAKLLFCYAYQLRHARIDNHISFSLPMKLPALVKEMFLLMCYCEAQDYIWRIKNEETEETRAKQSNNFLSLRNLAQFTTRIPSRPVL